MENYVCINYCSSSIRNLDAYAKNVPRRGPVNIILQRLGLISEPIQFLTNGTNARIFVILVNMWVGIPYTMLITSGILMNIPEDLYESAKIDGAVLYSLYENNFTIYAVCNHSIFNYSVCW